MGNKELSITFSCKPGDIVYAIGVLSNYDCVEQFRVINRQYHDSNIQTIMKYEAVRIEPDFGYYTVCELLGN